MDTFYNIISGIKEFATLVAIPVGISAIYLALKSRTVLNQIKENIEVFFEKERLLKGYDFAKESFKKFITNPEDIEVLEEGINKYYLNIKQIFSDESKYQIKVYNCDWAKIQQCSIYEDYTIEIAKEKNRKTMPEIYFPNKSKRGQSGFLVKIISSGSILQKDSHYFIFFRLSFITNPNTNLKTPQGCWLIIKTIDYQNKKYPFIFKPEANQSFDLTADEFMKKRK